MTGILPFFDGRAEAPSESLGRYVLRQLGFEVTPQCEVQVEERTYRGDLAVEDLRLIVEVDGRIKYEGPDAADVVMAEKAREAALNRAGWTVVRLTWREIVTPDGRLRTSNVRAIIDTALRRRTA